MTQSSENFSLLRRILHALGLSAEAIDDIIERINDFLYERDEKTVVEFPYELNNNFLSPAEQSFFFVLKSTVSDWAMVCPKVKLGDLFKVESNDPSKFRTYTNKIDRKHVDFLLCDLKTARPMLGIELDDSSHRRADRQRRDELVQNVFKAANLPLVQIPVRTAYAPAELNALLKRQLDPARALPDPTTAMETPAANITPPLATPRCPKCGSEMVLQTARKGAHPGSQFWGCSTYPRCRGTLNYEPQTKKA